MDGMRFVYIGELEEHVDRCVSRGDGHFHAATLEFFIVGWRVCLNHHLAVFRRPCYLTFASCSRYGVLRLP